jgi:hypothetical protein
VAPEAPTAAFFAAFLGSVLMIAAGLVILAGGNGAVPASWALGATATQLGGVGMTAGIGVLAAGFLLHENRSFRREIGGAIIVLSAGSVFGGAGFWIGMALGVVGGVLAIVRPTRPLMAGPTPP